MKFIIVACLFGGIFAAPQNPQFPRERQEVNPNNNFRTLRDERTPVIGAVFKYVFETDNGIYEEREGTEGSNGQSNMAGTYRFQTPDGQTVEIRYVADENGFRPEGDAIPAMPAHALEQIRIAEQQRADGVRWDDKGFRI